MDTSAAASDAAKFFCAVPEQPAKKKKSPSKKPAKSEAKTVTLSDVADFAPTDAAVHGEPEGWALVGLPANFVVDAHAATVTAKLLGREASVRFTPVAYRWDYGDGQVKVTTTPGTTWEKLGQDELTTTPTGHVFAQRGTYDGDVRVAYAAAYRYGDGGWHNIPGTVTGQPIPFETLVVAERTTLVNNDT